MTEPKQPDPVYARAVAQAEARRARIGLYMNFGYWKSDTATQLEACDNLVELVVRAIEPTAIAGSPDASRTVLDVGCGLGGISQYLTRYYAPENITAINIDAAQLEICRRHVPGVQFVQMDAAKMAFAGQFDRIISVEAAMLFSSRTEFFARAYDALKPGGYLAMSDPLAYRHPPRISGADEYAERLVTAGFCEVTAMDIGREVMLPYRQYCLALLRKRLAANQITEAQFRDTYVGQALNLDTVTHYIVARGRKPVAEVPAWKRTLAEDREFTAPIAGHLRAQAFSSEILDGKQ
jgi:trans-aconitate methyltransferase